MTAPRRVLVVEDDRKISALICDYLKAAGFASAVAYDGPAALAEARRRAPDAVILDLNLPGLDGMAVCRELRTFCAAPVLMLTARVEEIDRLQGLAEGADDYVCKPFSPREVMARMEALIRRASGEVERAAKSARWTVEEAGQRIGTSAGQWLPLTALEFRLFHTLVAQPGRVFSRAQLLERLHDDFRDISDRAIDGHIRNVRRKIAEAGRDPQAIVSVYGAGYRFDG